MSNTVAFIGLGNMGARMANNLIKKGTKLKVFDVVPAAAQSIQGATACKSPEEAASDASVIITMLPHGGIVKDTLLQDNGILKGMKKNAIHVDCSTIDPAMARELSAIAKKNNIRFVDAPVSGGIRGAQEATLTFMVGGENADMKEIEPILLKAGARVVHCGGPGAGQVAKIANNLILGATMIATAEALNLGIKSGLDAKVLSDIINTSSGRSWTSEIYNPVPGVMKNTPAEGGYQGGFMTKLIAKDMALAETIGLTVDAPLPMTGIAHQMYRAMMAHDMGDNDFSIIYQFLKGKK